MPKFGLIGPSYTLDSISAEAQKCMNWYPEVIESGAGRGPMRLCATPGIKKFAFQAKLSEGPNTAKVAVDDASSGTVAWVNPTDAEVLDAAYATVTVATLPPGVDVSHYLALSGYGKAVPANATVFGVGVDVTGHYTSTGPPGILTLTLLKAGVVQPASQKIDPISTTYGPADITVLHGGSTDHWNIPLSPADINDPGFGVVLQIIVTIGLGTTTTFFVDAVTLTVWYGTPLGGTSSRGLHPINDRVFAVVGPNFYELGSNGVVTLRGALADDGETVSIAGGPTQLLIVSGGVAYSYDLVTDVLAPIVGMLGTPSLAGYSDGYFIAMLESSQRFQISGLLDATTWDPLDVAQVSVFPDNLVSMLVDHRELWLWGKKASQVYIDTGNPDFPWEPIPGAFIEQGCGAKRSPVRLDNSVFWLGEDERGAAVAWRASGYTPTRVSNHAVEQAWQTYSTVTDVVSYAYQADGHSFWVLSFPTAKATWVYDASTGMWHERGTWDPNLPGYIAHRSQCHAYAWGKHLVGDRLAPNIYEMGRRIRNEDGNPIRQLRRTPIISNEWNWIYFRELLVDMESGSGDPVDPTTDPQVIVRWSNDFGHTWGNQHLQGAGRMGEYSTRVHFHQLGRARGRTFEFVVCGPVSQDLIEGYIQADGGKID